MKNTRYTHVTHLLNLLGDDDCEGISGNCCFCWRQVTTEDGYILSLQRMPAGRSGEKADKPPVLLQHGIFSVSCVNAEI